jgi:hypothetical protein
VITEEDVRRIALDLPARSSVLVRLEAVDPDETRELITDSWHLRAPRSLTKSQGGRRRASVP